MTVLGKIIDLIVNRLSLGGHSHRDVIQSVLRQLPQAAYWRLRERGFEPRGIVDIGAHEGDWTRMIRRIFPAPPIVMIEAREEQAQILQQVCAAIPRTEFSIALLGREPKASVPFHVSDTASSIFVERSDISIVRRDIPMKTLDAVISRYPNFEHPLLLKLDIQGAELECLRGGTDTLTKSEVIQLEVALLDYNESAPQMAEIISYMATHNFAVFDIAGFIRPDGINLVQIDIIFVRKDSRLRPTSFSFK